MDGQFHHIHYIWPLSFFFMTQVFHYHISETDSYVFFNFKTSYGSTAHTHTHTHKYHFISVHNIMAFSAPIF